MSNRIKIDPNKAAVINDVLTVKPDVQLSDKNLQFSIDDLMERGLKNLYRLMNLIENDIKSNIVDRNTIMNLKDVMAMIHDLKKREEDLLKDLTDEQLEQMLKK